MHPAVSRGWSWASGPSRPRGFERISHSMVNSAARGGKLSAYSRSARIFSALAVLSQLKVSSLLPKCP